MPAVLKASQIVDGWDNPRFLGDVDSRSTLQTLLAPFGSYLGVISGACGYNFRRFEVFFYRSIFEKIQAVPDGPGRARTAQAEVPTEGLREVYIYIRKQKRQRL